MAPLFSSDARKTGSAGGDALVAAKSHLWTRENLIPMKVSSAWLQTF
jgi:hypothetical protein